MDCIHTDMVTSASAAVSAPTPATGALPPLVSIVAAVNSALGPRYQVISVGSAAHVWDEVTQSGELLVCPFFPLMTSPLYESQSLSSFDLETRVGGCCLI